MFGHDRLLLFWVLVHCTQWKVIIRTVSVSNLSCLIIKSLTNFSGSSGVCSGMPMKTKLSIYNSRMLSLMALFSATTEVSWVVNVWTECFKTKFSLVRVSVCSWLNSKLSCSSWNSLTSISVILASSPESLFWMESRMLLTSLQHSGLSDVDSVVTGLESGLGLSLLEWY